MQEWLMILAMGAGGVLFAVGGTGPKWARRFLLPAILALAAFFSGIIWWRCLAFGSTQIITLCLPYGQRTPYWLKFVVFISYVGPSFFFGFTWWQAITPVVCFGCFKLSNAEWAGGTFVWKICEFVMGSCIGITVASLISQTYGG